ncbi:MAG: hypothetical protein OHK0029_24780 [Armatimonadaceae bacterium]
MIARKWVGTILAGCLTLGFALSPVVAQEPIGGNARPVASVQARARVALLPVINFSGEKDDKQRRDQIAKAEEELAKQFRNRGFTLIDRAAIEQSLTDADIDLTDEEYHNRATLYRIGKAVNAEVIAFVVILDVDQRRVETPLDIDEMVGKAKTKMWVLDVANEKPIVNAVRQESQSRSNIVPSLDSGARLIRKAVEGAVRDTLKPYLNQLPVAQK